MFKEHYAGGDTIVSAWAKMRGVIDLSQHLYEERATGMGFPFIAGDVYYPGLAVAAYLDQHPEAATSTEAELMNKLAAWGLQLMKAELAT